MMTTLFVFVILGALASLLLNLNEAKAKKQFRFKTFIKLNAMPTISNIIVGICIVAAAYDEPSWLEITKLTAFILGAISQQFFKKLCNIFLSNKPTYIGINKNETDDADAAEGNDF